MFSDLRYGLFLHYGLYSLLGRGEWVWNREEIPAEEYRALGIVVLLIWTRVIRRRLTLARFITVRRID